ncbi:hypothetical protein CPVG_00033 [Cyanophage KBS-S-1A]|nr:hypothetical protein CPVG_00033 [Cyanophage KBS-S-1A]
MTTAVIIAMIKPHQTRYQVFYTRGGAACPGSITACEYVTASTSMEAWSKGEALAVGFERVADVVPVNQPPNQHGAES